MREEELKPSGAAEAGRISSGQFHHGAGGSPGTNAHYSLAPKMPHFLSEVMHLCSQPAASPSGALLQVEAGPQWQMAPRPWPVQVRCG